MALARAAGHPDTLVLALSQRFRALWRDCLVDEQDDIGAELVVTLEAGGVTPGFAAVAHLVVAVLALSHADRRAFELHLSAARADADRSRLPGLLSQVGWAEVAWLAARGQYDDALVLARDVDRLYRRARGWQADDILGAFELSIAVDRGTLADHLPQAHALVDGGFASTAREVVAWMLVEDGQLDDARALVGPAGTVPDPAPDWLWLETVTAAAHVRASLGDTPACAALFERLLPFAGRCDVTTGPFLGGVDLALARLADVLGDHTAARHYAAGAVGMLEALDTPPALARALVVQGSLLAAADDPADREQAPVVLDRAHRIAESIGLVPVLAALDRMQAASKVGGG